MSDQAARTGRRPLLVDASVFFLLFGLFYLAVRHIIGPHLIYQYQTPVFLMTGDFFRACLGRPGGPTEYAALFLAQFCYYPWLGALLITSVAAGVSLLTRGFLDRMAGARVSPWLVYLPAALLLMLHGQYGYLLRSSVALLVTLVFVNLYVRGPRNAWLRAGLYAAMTLLLYWLAGGISVLFGVLCGVYELAVKRRTVFGVLCILSAAAAPAAVALWSYGAASAEAFVNLHPYRSIYPQMRPGPGGQSGALSQWLSLLGILHLSLMLFFPLAALAARFQAGLRRGLDPARRLCGKAFLAAKTPAAGAWTARSLALFLAAGATGFFTTHDPGVAKRLAIDYYAERHDWQAVLDVARTVPSTDYDIYTMHEVNRALFHTGRLADDLCRFPQFVHTPSVQLTTDEMNDVGYTKFAEFSLEMGAVNFVQHWAETAWEIHATPRLGRLLVKMNVLLKRPQAARTYLRLLGRNPISRDWADRYLAALDADPYLLADPEMQAVREVMVNRDHGYGGFGGFNYEQMLMQFIECNPRNREAVEYLMAYYLLTRQTESMVANIAVLNDLRLKTLPRSYEEALALYNAMHPDKPVTPDDRGLSPECLLRFDGFLADLDRYQHGPESQKKEALDALTRKWGDTYFFFAAFGFTEPRPGWRMVKPLPPGTEGKP